MRGVYTLAPGATIVSPRCNFARKRLLTDAMVRLLDQMGNQPQEREGPPAHMVPFPICSSTMIPHEWNGLDYRDKADGRSLTVGLDRCPVIGLGSVYLTPGSGQATA